MPSRSLQGESLFGLLINPASVAAFGQRHFARRFSKISARSRLRPVQTAAEINPVQVQLHDLLFAEMLLDPAREKNLEQFAAERSFLERKTVARQLLRDRARSLPDMARSHVLQRRAHNPEQIVTAVLIKLVVLDRDDGVDEIARQLFVGNGLAVLDVNLTEDLIVPVHDHARRFHLFELVQIEGCGLAIETVRNGKNVNAGDEQKEKKNRDRNVKDRPPIQGRAKTVQRAKLEIRNRHAGDKD